ncbi:MAG: hypothetical protein R3Y35_14390 [Clostridia bacterium]
MNNLGTENITEMIIDKYKISMKFSDKENKEIVSLIKNALIGSYLKSEKSSVKTVA